MKYEATQQVYVTGDRYYAPGETTDKVPKQYVEAGLFRMVGDDGSAVVLKRKAKSETEADES